MPWVSSWKSGRSERTLTDYRSVERLDVYRDDICVGTLQRLPKGCNFEYLETTGGPIALHLPREGVTVEGLANLPTYFAGLLPEGVMYAVVKTLIGAAADDLFAILAATGSDAIGDIDVRIPGDSSHRPLLSPDEANDVIQEVLSGSTDGANHTSAIAGVHPKLSVGQLTRSSRLDRSIAKFNSPDFPGMTRVEFACMQLAKRCRMQVADVALTRDFLMVKRFDRVVDNKAKQVSKVHQEDLLQVMDLFPNSKYSLDYGDIMTAMQRLGVSKASLLRAVELYAFSYLIGNGDLHAKNVSLIRDRQTGQWSLSPAYDLLSTLHFKHQMPGADRMALALGGGKFDSFETSDFLDFGEQFELPSKATRSMLSNLATKVQGNIALLEVNGLDAKVVEEIVRRAERLSD